MIVELIRRKPIPPEKEGMVHAIGLVLLLIHFRFLTIFRDIQIWQSDWEEFSVSVLKRILIIRIFPEVLRSFGADGIFLLVPGSEIMSIFQWAVIGFLKADGFSTFLWFGC